MLEAANVTGLSGKTVQGSNYAVDKSSTYSRKFQQQILNANHRSIQQQKRKTNRAYKQTFAFTERQDILSKEKNLFYETFYILNYRLILSYKKNL